MKLNPLSCKLACAATAVTILSCSDGDDSIGETSNPDAPRILALSGPTGASSAQFEDPLTKNWNTPDVPVSSLTDLTQTEPSVFVNPNNNQELLVSCNSEDFPYIDRPTSWHGANYWVSTDAGQTWNGSRDGVVETNKGDPAAVIGRDNVYHIGHIAEVERDHGTCQRL